MLNSRQWTPYSVRPAPGATEAEHRIAWARLVYADALALPRRRTHQFVGRRDLDRLVDRSVDGAMVRMHRVHPLHRVPHFLGSL